MLAKGATPFIILPVLIGLAVGLWGYVYGAAISASLTYTALAAGTAACCIGLFGLWFFRDPERNIANGIVSPADGKVLFIEPFEDEVIGEGQRVAIFMSPLNVHVNRAPISGRLLELVHHDGGYLPAFDKESERNERVETIWEADGRDEEIGGMQNGERVRMVQIAGAVARRIVPWIEPGNTAARGERIGLIRYGSRVDVYLPADLVVSVSAGQTVQAGATMLARCAS